MRFVPRVGRRVPLPPEVASALGLDELPGGDRLLAWSLLVGGGAAAATVQGVRVVTPRGVAIRRPWLDVDQAVWEQESGTLVIWWVGSRQPTGLEIRDDVGRLPEVVRERVQSSVVVTAPVSLPGDRPGRVALRRDLDGGLVAQSFVPPGVKREAPDVAAALDAALVALWSEAGDRGLNQGAPPPL